MNFLKKNIMYILGMTVPILIFVLYFLPIRVINDEIHGVLRYDVIHSLNTEHHIIVVFSLIANLALFVCSLFFIIKRKNQKTEIIIISILFLIAIALMVLTLICGFVWTKVYPK